MLRESRPVRPLVAALAAACVLACPRTAYTQIQANYLFTLSSFSGRLPYDWVRVRVDPQTDETYVIYQNIVRIFHPSGMEVFSFGDDLDLGHIVDSAVDRGGNIILLSYKESRPLVTRCNFRGVPVAAVEIRNLPAGVSFGPSRMIYREGLLYFASLSTASVIVTDEAGEFRRHIDFLSMLELDARQQGGAEMIGFTVDGDGSIFFTIPTLFKVFKLSPDGKLASFGRSGSAPGRFGVIAGIASDADGHLVIADKLKCVVMVFDREFGFITEFGYRGPRPENLIVPDEVAVDGRGRVYVSQGRSRGVSVFALTH